MKDNTEESISLLEENKRLKKQLAALGKQEEDGRPRERVLEMRERQVKQSEPDLWLNAGHLTREQVLAKTVLRQKKAIEAEAIFERAYEQKHAQTKARAMGWALMFSGFIAGAFGFAFTTAAQKDSGYYAAGIPFLLVALFACGGAIFSCSKSGEEEKAITRPTP